MTQHAQQNGGEQWATRIGVILAVAGSAVGLGNFLRFPGQAAQYGGGAFMFPYFISLLILGIPICWAEWTMGRCAGAKGFNSAPGIYSIITRNPLARYFGALALLIPLIIYMYYVVIEAWCLSYAINYMTGCLMELKGPGVYETFFDDFVGSGENGALLAPGNRQLLFILCGVFILNFALIYRGVSKGIEKFCTFAMPIMVVCAVCVLVRVLTLGTPDPAKPDQSVLGGLGFMWNPNIDALKDPETWLAASSQIFFSLSVGFGIIINYASYVKRNDDIVLSGLTASSMNEFFEVCLGGLITLPAAFIFLGMAAEGQGTFDLGFKALPNVFAQMPAGQFFGVLWFFMLFIAAITSSLSMLQPVIAFFEEGFGLKRHASATFLGLISASGCGFVIYFSEGLVALDTFDFWVGSVLIFILAFVQTILYGWFFGIERGEAEAHRGAHIRIPRFVQYILKYIVPVYLFVIFCAFCWENVPSQENRIFGADAQFESMLEKGQVNEKLHDLFAANEIKLPKEIAVKVRETGAWHLVDAGGAVQYIVRKAENELCILEYQMGYWEKFRTDVVVFSSVMFILVVLAFMLVLVHIAGKRWTAEGKFDDFELES